MGDWATTTTRTIVMPDKTKYATNPKPGEEPQIGELGGRVKENSWFLVPVKCEGGDTFMWFSICSKHRSHDETCNLCNAGQWYKVKIGGD